MTKPFNPKVSIVIPVYNGSNYLKEAIDSALSQTYENTEVIVINDGSNDGGKTDKICKSYGKKIRYFKKENGGVASALNMGLEKMEGEYFSWLSHDDIYYPNKIEDQIKLLDMLDNKNTILYSNVEYIDENSKTIYKTEYENKYSVDALSNGVFAVFYGYTNGCSMLISKKCFEEIGGFNEGLKTANDYEMWFRLFKKYPVRFTPQTLIRYRFHDNQGTKVVPEESRIEESEKVWMRAIKALDIDEVESFGVEPVKFYYDLAKRMKEAGQGKTYKLVMKRAKGYYEENGPVVSVIMPCYNSVKYLEEAIDSILEQTFPNFELIIIDDGSTDKTWEMIQRYKREDYRILVSKNKYGKGISGAMNTGLDLSRGEYITRMDSDDISLPSRFEKQVAFLKENDEYGFCSVNMSAFGKINSAALYKEQDVPLEWLFFWLNPVPSAAAMYRADIIKRNNIRFRNYKVAEDYDFLTQVVIQTKGYVLYDESLYHYRIYAKSNFQKNLDLVLKNSKEINANFVKTVVGEYPPSLHWDLTEFTVPIQDKKELNIFAATDWMRILLTKSKEFWNWGEKQYEEALVDSEKRIKDFITAKTKREFEKEIEQKGMEIQRLKKDSFQNRISLNEYFSLLKKKYKRFWELIDSQGWKTTLKNIILKFKR
ncbi:MAG: glycosyltransferase [Caldisericia bacterium]|nr:glycosyltransferase [Caldisericia bacterium]